MLSRAFLLQFTLLAAGVAAAQTNENDVLICSPADEPDALATGVVDVISGQASVPVRVFGESAGPISGIDDLRGDEGFFAYSSAAQLPPGYVPPPGLTDIGFDFRTFTIGTESHNLWYWDPSTEPDVTFSAPPAGVSLSFTKTPVSFFTATVDGSPVDVPGFTIDRTSSAGGLHKHLNIVIADADDDPGTPVPPGIYAAAYTLRHESGASPPVILVLNGGMGAAGTAPQQAAIEFFESWISGDCPGDIDGDGVVGLSDLSALLTNFGSSASGPDGDLDGDGDVDLGDLSALLTAFGTNCSDRTRP